MQSSPTEAFLYTSRLASDAGIDCVADIVKTARAFNSENHITGVLIFDGERFCQYIEGPKASLDALIQRIAADSRHCEFNPQYRQNTGNRRLFANWSMAYAMVEDEEILQELSMLEGENAMGRLNEMLPLLDMA